MSRSSRRRGPRRLQALASVVLAIILLAILLALGGKEALLIALEGNLLFACGSIAAVILLTIIVTIRWRRLHQAIVPDRKLPWTDFYYAYIWGRVAALFLPRGIGEIAGRSVSARTMANQPVGPFVYSSTLDVIFDLLLVIVLVPSGLLYVFGWTGSLAVAATSLVLLLLMVLFAFQPAARLFSRIGGWLGWRLAAWQPSRPWLTNLRDRAVRLTNSFAWTERIDRDVAVAAVILTFVKYLLMVGRSWLAALALGIEVPFGLIFYSVALIQMTQIVPLTPGGWGVTELGWYGILSLGGITRIESVGFAIAQRVYIVAALLIGLAMAAVTSALNPTKADESTGEITL